MPNGKAAEARTHQALKWRRISSKPNGPEENELSIARSFCCVCVHTSEEMGDTLLRDSWGWWSSRGGQPGWLQPNPVQAVTPRSALHGLGQAAGAADGIVWSELVIQQIFSLQASFCSRSPVQQCTGREEGTERGCGGADALIVLHRDACALPSLRPIPHH